MNDALVIRTSQISDGSMSVGVSDEQRQVNRSRFLGQNDIAASQTILVHLQYQGDDYRRYFTVSSDIAGDGIVSGSTIVADALFTHEKNLALLLPVADCVGVVLYDSRHQTVGLAHLGRHNLAQAGGTSIVQYMANDFGTNPSELTVLLSAAAGRQNYPLYDFDNRSLHEVAIEQLLAAGVPAANIEIDERDTTQDNSLFSHSEFLKGNQALDGRQAIVCMMRA